VISQELPIPCLAHQAASAPVLDFHMNVLMGPIAPQRETRNAFHVRLVWMASIALLVP
jgi:hypothetical protein